MLPSIPQIRSRLAPAAGFASGLHRSRYLAILVALLVGILLAGIFGSWLLYASVRDDMDHQLEARILSIATTACQGIGSERFAELGILGPGSVEYERVRADLEKTADANDLDDITLLDASGRTLLDLRGVAKAGEPDPLLELMPELQATLLSGEPRATRLTEVEGFPGEYLKTGFAALEDSSGRVVGAVAVEGGSEFFSVLPGMRRKVLAAAAGGLLAVLVLGLLLFRVLRSFLRYEDSLRRAAALAAIGQISAIVAHEIKNPLAIIRSRSERVRAKIQAGRDPREVLDWFEAIPAEVDRLDSILTTYLSLARPEQEGDCRPAAVIEETCALLRSDLGKRGIRLRMETGVEDSVAVAMGARALRQILLNLLLNAAQATPEGGEIRVRMRREGSWVDLEVEDTGEGMGEEQRRRALEPFFTTRPTGSGLGLTLVHSLLQARGGTMEIHSEPHHGTRVVVRLPAGTDRAAP